MATFIRGYNDCYLNLDQIQSIRPRKDKDGNWVYAAHTDDGRVLGEWTGEVIDNTIYPIIPAQPGFTLLTVWFNTESVPDNLSEWVTRDPIIAWRMESYGPQPVTLEDGGNRNAEIQAIECPGGKIVDPLSASYPSWDEFIEDVRKQWQRHIARAEAEARKKG